MKDLPQEKLDLFDICENKHGGVDTSVEAFNSTPKEVRVDQRERVFQFILNCGLIGATRDEVARALGLPSQSASPRVAELQAVGRVVKSGAKRNTLSGKPAHVMIVPPGGK